MPEAPVIQMRLRKAVDLFRNPDPYLYLRNKKKKKKRTSALSCPILPVGFSTLSRQTEALWVPVNGTGKTCGCFHSKLLPQPRDLSLECAEGSQRSPGVSARPRTSPFFQMLPWSRRGRTGLQKCACCVFRGPPRDGPGLGYSGWEEGEDWAGCAQQPKPEQLLQKNHCPVTVTAPSAPNKTQEMIFHGTAY